VNLEAASRSGDIAPEPPPESDAAPAQPHAGSRVRAFFYLIWLSWQRQARMHLLLWIALGLLALTAFVVYVIERQGRWTMADWRFPNRSGLPYRQYFDEVESVGHLPWRPALAAGQNAIWASLQTVLYDASGFFVFSNGIVFTLYATFLLPLWSLAFATEGLGREREARNLLWVLTRPLSRPAIYLAKYFALLPWCLLLNVGGFVVLCLVAQMPGRIALACYWPAVLWATFAFAALFHLMAACFRRAPVLAILYTFFFETIAGNLPGHLKRLSISFYTRCLMFDRAHSFGVHPDRPHVYLPVSGPVALAILIGATLCLLAIGMIVFARKEYLDVA
jgi:ABC-type transport system involved in multi-copper enzyme maturation permease subunit